MTIATYDLPQDMIVAKAKLEANGIECFVKDELTAQVHNFLSNAIGGIKLQVLEENAEKAIQVLQESNPLEADYPEAKLKCTNCGSGNVDGIGLNGKLALVFLFILGIPVPFKSGKARCYDCQNVFNIKDRKRP